MKQNLCERVIIRNARPDDATFIGHAVAEAIGIDTSREYTGGNPVDVFAEIASTPDSQYSYRNALIAEIDNEPAGVIVGYDGAHLDRLRDGSLKVIRKYHPDIIITDDETEPGEYYLDTLAVDKRFRGCGIGRKLISSMIERAREQGKDTVGLLVDFENPNAERLYRYIGFTQVGERPFFGHNMKHLQIPTGIAVNR